MIQIGLWSPSAIEIGFWSPGTVQGQPSPIMRRPTQRSDTLLRNPSADFTLSRPSAVDGRLVRHTASQ